MAAILPQPQCLKYEQYESLQDFVYVLINPCEMGDYTIDLLQHHDV